MSERSRQVQDGAAFAAIEDAYKDLEGDLVAPLLSRYEVGPGGWWARHFLLNEAVLSAALAGAAILWMERFGGWKVVNTLLQGNRGAIYGALASIFGSLLGFIITAVSIALGFSASENLTIVRESRYYSHLWSVFMSATRWLAMATIASIAALVADRDSAPIRELTYAVWLLAVLSAVRVARCLWVLENVVRIVTKPNERKAP